MNGRKEDFIVRDELKIISELKKEKYNVCSKSVSGGKVDTIQYVHRNAERRLCM